MPRRFATLFAVFALAAPASTARAQSQTEQLARAGITNLMAQKFPEAEAAFRKLYEAEPDKIRGLMGVVEVYMAQGKEDDAQRLLDAEILKPPARPDLLVFAGDTAMRTKNYDKAVVRFQQAIEAIDFKSEGTFYVHRAATTGNSLADSVNALIGPDATPKGAAGVYLRLCEAWRRKGDDPSALDAIRHAKELAPRDSAVLWYFATPKMRWRSTMPPT
ncbi:MAG: tetratricopeptide repeat protein [Bryobacteraceae bacterium]